MGNENEQTIEEHRQRIQFQYSVNNIIREKSELYFDFLLSLLNILNETYLGPDTISTQDDMVNHFSWCFNKVLEHFEHERIKFTPISTITYDYLWYFIYKGFYSSEMENKYEALLEYFTYLFDYDGIKTPPELESYIDFYKIFDQNLKKLN